MQLQQHGRDARILRVHVIRGHVLLKNGGAARGEHHAAQLGHARARGEHRLRAAHRGRHEKLLAQARGARGHHKGARGVVHHGAARKGGVKARRILAQQVRLKQREALRGAGQRAQVRGAREGAHRAVHARAAREERGNELSGNEARGASDADALHGSVAA